MLDLTVIVPVRNAENFIESCLRSIAESQPAELIVVDGNSTDRTVEIARRYTERVYSDDGRGVAAARMLGAAAASRKTIALIDVDIVLPDGALANLLDEFQSGGYTALQAGLHSAAGPGYWGQALAFHHNHGRSKHWPGVMATVFDRDVFLRHGLDEQFASGEDIELRWRLQRAGSKLGVSRRTIVTHRFEDTFACARGQFVADGQGLARMVRKHGWRAVMLLGIPAAGAVRGIGISLLHRQPRWIPYFITYGLLNYTAAAGILFGEIGRLRTPDAPMVEHAKA